MKIALRIRAGFTLMEIAVAAVLLAILASVTAPYLVRYLDNQRAVTTADELEDMSNGIASFAAVVRTGAASTQATFPGFLSELANPITTSEKNSCNTAANHFNATAVTDWTSYGPFVAEYLPTTGFKTPLGTVNDSMIRSSASGTAGTLTIQIPNVDTADAVKLDLIIDGANDSTSGRLLWTRSGALATMKFLVPVGHNC